MGSPERGLTGHVTLKELPPAERPRERLFAVGPGQLTSAELLAILLRTGAAGQTAVQVAQRLLVEGEKQTGRPLHYLLRASAAELAAHRGVGRAKAAQIKAALELGRRVLEEERGVPARIHGPADVAALVMEEMRHLEQEQFKVILLDTKNQVLDVELVSSGTLNTTIVHPREIFKLAIRRAANAIILVHNHPSGDPTPSPEDRRLTSELIAAGNLLGIDVHDHVIIGDRRYFSLRQGQGVVGRRCRRT